MFRRLKGTINAWGLAALDGYMHRHFGALKARLFADLPARVVELGSGSGTNFRYLRAGQRVVSVEPNVHAHSMLRRRAAAQGLTLDLHAAFAEHLDLPDDSVDAVICSLVLCSVRDPVAAIAEVRRVLKPGGRFVCIEHVAAAPGSGLARIQRVLRRPWYWAFDGCDLCRDTGAMLREAGFSQVEIEPRHMRTFAFPIAPQIVAVCVK